MWSTAEGPRARPLAGYFRTAMTFDIQMSTNTVMPHPNDALLRHDDYLIVTSYDYCAGTWRHRQVGGGHQKRVMAGKMTSMGLDLRHCGFGKPRAIPRQLIKAVGSAGGALGGKDLEQERNFPMGGVEAWFVRSEPLSCKVMNDWLDVMSVTPTRPMKHGVKKSGVRQRVGVKMTSSVHSIKAMG